MQTFDPKKTVDFGSDPNRNFTGHIRHQKVNKKKL